MFSEVKMRGKRKKALKRELSDLIGRAPRAATYQVFSSGEVRQKTKDEMRTYKRAFKATRNVGK